LLLELRQLGVERSAATSFGAAPRSSAALPVGMSSLREPLNRLFFVALHFDP
jgi:hypothetical protein